MANYALARNAVAANTYPRNKALQTTFFPRARNSNRVPRRLTKPTKGIGRLNKTPEAHCEEHQDFCKLHEVVFQIRKGCEQCVGPDDVI